VILVNREREEIKSGKKSFEQSYYLTNERKKYQEICEAVRGHWGVETNNHLRDVTLKEDSLRTKKKSISRVMTGIRTLAIKVLAETKCENKRSQLEDFSDNFDGLIEILKKLKFL
jgi:predicted transposase YbfD/YdcC